MAGRRPIHYSRAQTAPQLPATVEHPSFYAVIGAAAFWHFRLIPARGHLGN